MMPRFREGVDSIVHTAKDTIGERIPPGLRARMPWAAPPPPSKIKRALPLIGAGAAGAISALLLDPAQGRARRAKLRDMAAGTARRTGRRFARAGRKVSSDAYGMRQKIAHDLAGKPEPVFDDVTLAHKVQSEVLGDPDFRGANIVLNVEDGMVVLRGQLTRPDQIRRLEKAVSELPGVAGVQSFLHLEGTPAPNKQEAIEASREAIRSRPT